MLLRTYIDVYKCEHRYSEKFQGIESASLCVKFDLNFNFHLLSLVSHHAQEAKGYKPCEPSLAYPLLLANVPSLLYGAVQNGKLLNPGSRNKDGLGRSKPVEVSSDGPFTTVAVSYPS